MKKTICLIFLFSFSFAHADSVFRIEIGKDYKSYSHSDLQRRVWELERAVWQLQARVFELELGKPSNSTPAADSWICTYEAMGTSFTGTGATKAVAKSKALESCKNSQKGDGFFCKEKGCEQ